MLKHAPHAPGVVLADEWDRPYGREQVSWGPGTCLQCLLTVCQAGNALAILLCSGGDTCILLNPPTNHPSFYSLCRRPTQHPGCAPPSSGLPSAAWITFTATATWSCACPRSSKLAVLPARLYCSTAPAHGTAIWCCACPRSSKLANASDCRAPLGCSAAEIA